MTSDEKEKLESAVNDEDMVQWYNRVKVNKADRELKTIPGCFYKVRA